MSKSYTNCDFITLFGFRIQGKTRQGKAMQGKANHNQWTNFNWSVGIQSFRPLFSRLETGIETVSVICWSLQFNETYQQIRLMDQFNRHGTRSLFIDLLIGHRSCSTVVQRLVLWTGSSSQFSTIIALMRWHSLQPWTKILMKTTEITSKTNESTQLPKINQTEKIFIFESTKRIEIRKKELLANSLVIF